MCESGPVRLDVLFHGLYAVDAEDLYFLLLQFVDYTANDGVRDIQVAKFGPPDGQGGFVAKAVLQLVVTLYAGNQTIENGESGPKNHSVLQLPGSTSQAKNISSLLEHTFGAET